MSYEKCISLTASVKKEEINVTSYCSNVQPATPHRWSVNGNNFRDKIKNLLDMYIGGSLQLLASNKSNAAFALKLTRDYFEVLTNEKLNFGDCSFYDMVKPFNNSLDSNSFSIAISRKFSGILEGKNSDEKNKTLKNLESYKDYVESFKNYYNFYNNEIVQSLIDFFLKVLNKDYDKAFEEKKFTTFLEYDGRIYIEVKIKPTIYGHKFVKDYEYKNLKGAYYSNLDAYGFTTKVQTDSYDILENLEILQMISKISEGEKEEFQTTYKKLSDDLKNSVNEMLEEVKNKQRELV